LDWSSLGNPCNDDNHDRLEMATIVNIGGGEKEKF
jgi:hypothetical protein